LHPLIQDKKTPDVLTADILDISEEYVHPNRLQAGPGSYPETFMTKIQCEGVVRWVLDQRLREAHHVGIQSSTP